MRDGRRPIRVHGSKYLKVRSAGSRGFNAIGRARRRIPAAALHLIRFGVPGGGQVGEIFVDGAELDIVHLAERPPWHPFGPTSS